MGYNNRFVKILNFVKNNPLLILFITISIVLIFLVPWLNPKPKYGGDWHYKYDELIKENYRIPEIWENTENFGQNNSNRIPIIILDYIEAFVSHITNTGFTQTEVILWFIPFLLFSFFGTYFLSYKFFNSKKAAMISGFVYTVNTYTLVIFSEAGHINLLVAYSIVPFSILCLIRFISNLNLLNLTLYTLSTSLIFLYDIRIGIISFIIQTIYIVYKYIYQKNEFPELLKFFNWISLAVTILIFLNVYWILPLITTPIDSQIPANQNTSDWVYRLSYEEISHGLFLEHPFWTFSKVTYFVENNVSIVFAFFTIVIILGLILNKSFQTKKNIIMLIIVWMVGIFALKGSNQPQDDVYIWMFDNVRIFKMFREPQKFYILCIFPAALLFGISVKNIYERLKNIKFSKITMQLYKVLIAVFICISIAPAYLFKLNGNLKARDIPDYSEDIYDLVKNDNNFYRTLWIPQVTPTSFRNDLHPRLDFSVGLDQFLNIGYEDPNDVYTFLTSKNFDYFLKTTSVKYIIFPKDDEVLKWYSSNLLGVLNDTIDDFKNSNRYNVNTDKGYIIFEYKDYNPLIYAYQNPTYTNSDLLNHPLIQFNSTDNGNYIFDDDNLDIPDQVYLYSNTYLDITQEGQINNIQNNTITSKFNLKNNNIFNLIDTKQTEYYTAKFINIGENLFRIEYTPIDEKIKLSDSVLITNKNTLESKNSFSIEKDNLYLIKINNSVEIFNYDEIINSVAKGMFYIGNENTSTYVYKLNKELYLNEHFDLPEELDVGDCNNFDNLSLKDTGISYSFSPSGDDGSNALLLQANKHIACYTKAFFTNNKDSLFLLTFKYKHISGSLPELCIYDNSKNECILKRTMSDATTDQWRQVSIPIYINKNESRFNIYLYSNATEVPSKNLYDDVKIQGFELKEKIGFNTMDKNLISQNSQGIFLNAKEQYFSVTSPTIHNIDISNNSFENPINYQLLAKDCNNADGSSIDKNNIKAEQVEDSVDQRFSLKLSGDKHMACYNIPIGNLTTDYSYYLKFSYKTSSTTSSKFCVLNKKTERCIILEELDSANEWIDKELFLNLNNSDYELYLYSFSEQGDNTSYYTNFDNISLTQIPKNYIDRYSIQGASTESNVETIPEINYEIISPTRIIVHIKNAQNAFFLNYSMKYDDSWELLDITGVNESQLKNGFYNISSEVIGNHFKSNKYLNSWIIDKNGDMTLLLQYKEQKKFLFSSFLSLVALIILILLILITFIYNVLKTTYESISNRKKHVENITI